jgi:hypothetical protein
LADIDERVRAADERDPKDLPAPLHLELVEATTYATGLAIHVYRPRSSPADQPVDPDQPEQEG